MGCFDHDLVAHREARFSSDDEANNIFNIWASVFGVSDEMRLNTVFSATETS